ncbi:MAG: Wzz/FepE/Etk N-terminal domain-containing protein [Coriobacteriia bacterium]|nr:Wzz/FepE/Etk N-terminal domain-containing protein [Coriobacteriia bacterium]
MTLLELLQLLRKHLRLVVALPVAFALVAAVYCWGFMPNQYTAETSIYALSKTETTAQSAEAGPSYGDLNASQLLANDFAELAKNEQVQNNTALALGMEDLEGYKVNITSSTTTRVIKLSVTGGDPNNVALIANKLASEIGSTATKVMDVKAVNIITQAKAPDKPSGPRRAMYTLVALLAGLFLAVALVVLMDMVNTTIRNDEDITEGLGLPVIGRFPEQKGGRR